MSTSRTHALTMGNWISFCAKPTATIMPPDFVACRHQQKHILRLSTHLKHQFKHDRNIANILVSRLRLDGCVWQHHHDREQMEAVKNSQCSNIKI